MNAICFDPSYKVSKVKPQATISAHMLHVYVPRVVLICPEVKLINGIPSIIDSAFIDPVWSLF